MAEAPVPRSSPPHVVIVGGGFSGLYAAKALKNVPVRVTLIDRTNYHLFQPLLYQVATAALSPANVASPIRAILRRQRNVTTLLGDVTGIDADRREVILRDQRLPYDALILATGARHAYFGHPEWEALAPDLKGIDDAPEIRRHVFLAFEAAERETDPERRAALLSFVVVGGGPTGVELAGALGEIAHDALRRDFRRIDPDRTRILLVDSGDRVLRSYSPKLSASAERQLARLGVTVRTHARVAAVEPAAVVLTGGERIPATTVLWAAGVVASSLGASLGAPLDEVGRVLVEPDLSVPGHPELFVAGDLAALNGRRGELLSGVCPVAIQEGHVAAANVERFLRGDPTVPFRYRDKGSLATIGRNSGIADIRGIQLSGFIAWLAWLLIHIFFLIGFRNRLLVMLQWGWAYLIHGRGARLITPEWAASEHATVIGTQGVETPAC